MPRRQQTMRTNRMQPYQADRNVNQRENNRQSQNLFRQSLLSEFMGMYGRQREGGHRRNAVMQNDENALPYTRPVSRRGGQDNQPSQDNHRQLYRNTRHGYVPVEYGYQRVPRQDLLRVLQGRDLDNVDEDGNRRQGEGDRDVNVNVRPEQISWRQEQTSYDSEGDPCPNLAEIPPTPPPPPLITALQLSRQFEGQEGEVDEFEELLRNRLGHRSSRREQQQIPLNQQQQQPTSVFEGEDMLQILEREVVGDAPSELGEGEGEEEEILGQGHQVQHYERVPSCSYLGMGMVFKGFQTVSDSLHSSINLTIWEVTVTIQACNMETGYVCGMMQANITTGSPAPGTVITCWVGEIIDNENYKFLTDKWYADRHDDNEYWARFPSYVQIADTVRQGRSNQLSQHSHIFMRWKEQFFVQENPNNQLSILGFYYVALDRRTGAIQGWYFSRCQESGCQELRLEVVQGQDLRTVCKTSKSKKSVRRNSEIDDRGRVKRSKGMQGQSFPAYAIY